MKCAGTGEMAEVAVGKGRLYRICPLCGLHQYFNYGGKLPNKLPMKLHEIRRFNKHERELL